MDLTQLKMFCSVADTGSLARAAERLHRVPSNLTTRLRQLEQELGADLFIREKQRLRLSPVGHNFLCYARRILALSEEALNMTHSGEPAGHFLLGSVDSAVATRLPLWLSAYHQQHPDVSLSLITGTSADMIERVCEGTLSAALVNGPITSDQLNRCKAFDERMVLISCLSHPPIHQPADAAGKTLFAFAPGCACRQRLENWFRNAGVQQGSVTEIHSYHTLLACVAGGAGLALLPESVLAGLSAAERTRRHDIPAEIGDITTFLVWRRDAFTANVNALKQLIITLSDDAPDEQECRP